MSKKVVRKKLGRIAETAKQARANYDKQRPQGRAVAHPTNLFHVEETVYDEPEKEEGEVLSYADPAVRGRCAHGEAEEPLPVDFNGTKRSERAIEYHLIPSQGLRRIGLRFRAGLKYGPSNWKRAMETADAARGFLDDAYNHAFEHLLRANDRPGDITNPAPDGDDNIGAVAWFCMIACYAEDYFAQPWNQIGRKGESE